MSDSSRHMEVIDMIPFEVISAKKEVKYPVVSVICITYRHGKYIKDCLNGILKQKTVYPYEVIIIDDASDDNTAEIIREYANKYRDRISAFIAGENIFSHGKEKLLSVREEIYKSALHGKYLAFCEGDDFWIDSNKLQIQTDFLEHHSDYVMTVHNSIRYTEDENRIEQVNDYEDDVTVNAWDIILRKKGAFSTASMMYRAEYRKYDNDFFTKCDIGDWTGQLYLFSKGKVYYHSRIMSVYRYMTDGSWTKRTHGDIELLTIHAGKMWDFFDRYNVYTNRKYERFLTWQKAMYALFLSERLKQEKKTTEYLESDNFPGVLSVGFRDEIDLIYQKGLDAHYYDDYFYDFVTTRKRIWLLGAGHFADVIKKKLSESGISVYGYAVLDGRDVGQEKDGHEIQDLKSLEWDNENDGLIVSIDFIREAEEILDTIDGLGIRNFIAPLWR